MKLAVRKFVFSLIDKRNILLNKKISGESPKVGEEPQVTKDKVEGNRRKQNLRSRPGSYKKQ